MFRTLTIAIRRYCMPPPAGTTHVLEYIPPWLMEPSPEEGAWCLQTIDNWYAGTPNGDLGDMDGAPDLPETVLRAFVEAEFGEQVSLCRFEVGIGDGGNIEDCPAYWVSPDES